MMMIDRKKDGYEEFITDRNGLIKHLCKEKLSQHKGHGCAKQVFTY